jgi:micrococcal nuclease
MISNGHAWFNARYSNDQSLAFAQQRAYNNHLGLWNAKQQTPPWVWRKNHPH